MIQRITKLLPYSTGGLDCRFADLFIAPCLLFAPCTTNSGAVRDQLDPDYSYLIPTGFTIVPNIAPEQSLWLPRRRQDMLKQ